VADRMKGRYMQEENVEEGVMDPMNKIFII
jgi:hypothetical protein